MPDKTPHASDDKQVPYITNPELTEEPVGHRLIDKNSKKGLVLELWDKTVNS